MGRKFAFRPTFARPTRMIRSFKVPLLEWCVRFGVGLPLQGAAVSALWSLGAGALPELLWNLDAGAVAGGRCEMSMVARGGGWRLCYIMFTPLAAQKIICYVESMLE